MSRQTALLTSALLLAAAPLLCAQQPTPVVVAGEPSAAPPARVATIFGQNALASTQEGQKAAAAMNAKFGPRQEEFNRKKVELDTLRDQLKKGQATMAADARAKLTQTIDAKSRELQRLGEDSQNAVDEEEARIMQDLGVRLQAVIQQYAASHGIAAVVDVSQPNGPVIWASPAIDITSEIVKLYDQLHPATPPAPPAKK